MGEVMVQALVSQCMPTWCEGGMRTLCRAIHRRGHHHTAQPTGRWEPPPTYDVISTDSDISGRVVDGERGPWGGGYGFSRFILHNRLYHNVLISCLRDDNLYFQVKSDPEKPWLTCTTVQYNRSFCLELVAPMGRSICGVHVFME